MASPEITLTHLDEPLFDGAGATKRDLVDYLPLKTFAEGFRRRE